MLVSLVLAWVLLSALLLLACEQDVGITVVHCRPKAQAKAIQRSSVAMPASRFTCKRTFRVHAPSGAVGERASCVIVAGDACVVTVIVRTTGAVAPTLRVHRDRDAVAQALLIRVAKEVPERLHRHGHGHGQRYGLCAHFRAFVAPTTAGMTLAWSGSGMPSGGEEEKGERCWKTIKSIKLMNE